MTPAGEMLLRDARAALLAEVKKARGRQDVEEAAILWLLADGDTEADIRGLADAAAGCRGQLRTYRQVAMLGYAVAALPAEFTHGEALEAGLRWLSGVPPTSAGSPQGFATDPIAALGIALGLQHASAETRAAGRAWMARFLPESYRAPNLEACSYCLWAAAQQVNDAEPALLVPTHTSIADLRVALRAKGVLSSTSDPAVDEDEQQALLLMKQEWQEIAPFRAAVRVAAYDWIRRSAPAVLPSRITPEDVALLLSRVEFALKRWTWEDRPKVTGGVVRQWHIDHEYHVQNLLWTILAPVFPDLTDEEYTLQLGSKNPRADIGIPSLQLIVEAKFMRAGDAPKKMIEQIAADASMYLVPGSRYRQMLAFIWDDAARTNQHDEMIRAMTQIRGVVAAIVVSRPGTWM